MDEAANNDIDDDLPFTNTIPDNNDD